MVCPPVQARTDVPSTPRAKAREPTRVGDGLHDQVDFLHRQEANVSFGRPAPGSACASGRIVDGPSAVDGGVEDGGEVADAGPDTAGGESAVAHPSDDAFDVHTADLDDLQVADDRPDVLAVHRLAPPEVAERAAAQRDGFPRGQRSGCNGPPVGLSNGRVDLAS